LKGSHFDKSRKSGPTVGDEGRHRESMGKGMARGTSRVVTYRPEKSTRRNIVKSKDINNGVDDSQQEHCKLNRYHNSRGRAWGNNVS